ncbi:hypothetical protein F4801DRAFT_117358 [Xylaria longipes]|nr:hypothetical protein F4801DRAFT_117358 [Xylaria longipes]
MVLPSSSYHQYTAVHRALFPSRTQPASKQQPPILYLGLFFGAMKNHLGILPAYLNQTIVQRIQSGPILTTSHSCSSVGQLTTLLTYTVGRAYPARATIAKEYLPTQRKRSSATQCRSTWHHPHFPCDQSKSRKQPGRSTDSSASFRTRYDSPPTDTAAFGIGGGWGFDGLPPQPVRSTPTPGRPAKQHVNQPYRTATHAHHAVRSGQAFRSIDPKREPSANGLGVQGPHPYSPWLDVKPDRGKRTLRNCYRGAGPRRWDRVKAHFLFFCRR